MERFDADDAVLINGAAGGIGQATVEAFLDQGAFVVGLDRAARVEEPRHERYLGIRVTLDEQAATQAAIEAARRAAGGRRLRCVVGIAGGADFREATARHFTEVPAEVVIDIIRQNFTNQYLFTQLAWPWLSASAGCDRSILFTSSINGLTGYRQPVYGAMKAALINLVQSLAGLVGREGVRVNAVAPGAVATHFFETSPGWERYRSKAKDEAAALARATALGRIAEPSDVADAFISLARLRHVTGQCLLVDGGQLLYPRELDDLPFWRIDERG